MAHDLLTQPLLSWRDPHRRRNKTTLPGVLARLASGELGDFSRLRTHQLHPWCMFLTQLAVIALQRDGSAEARLPEEEWRRLLLRLTQDQHEPWSLVVEDLSKPAFFQPPVPEGSTARWSVCQYPDDIDVLVTAKGHDVKTGLIHGEEPEAWVYALTTLQTMQGYPGRGYTRVSRMKRGYGNRPRVGVTRDHTLSARFLRDVWVMLEQWPDLVERGYGPTGVALSWVEPWDGQSSLPMGALAPHFIEVCWRVRCVESVDGLSCRYTTTKARRCLPEIEGGDVGDPWIPVERGDAGALTVGSRGFNYDLLTKVLFEGDFAPAAAQRLQTQDGDPMLFVASALTRGKGKTEGLHERVVVLKGKARPTMGSPDGRATLGRRASACVAVTANMRKKVLLPALKHLVLNVTRMLDDFDERVDEIFFDHLFETFDMSDEDARLSFERELRELAKAELERAISRTSVGDSRRFRAISAAERTFHSCLRKYFPDIAVARTREEGLPA